MKVRVDVDERYPFASVETQGEAEEWASKFDIDMTGVDYIEIPDSEWEEWVKVWDEFEKWQSRFLDGLNL